MYSLGISCVYVSFHILGLGFLGTISEIEAYIFVLEGLGLKKMFSIEIQPTPTPSLSPVPSQPPSPLFLSVGSAAAPFAVGSSRRSLVTQKASRGRSFSSLSSPRHSLPLWFSPLLGRDGLFIFSAVATPPLGLSLAQWCW
ncbi:hypothetical protein ACOSQ4_024308 [Xanthoceras sorbifolium]